MADGALLREPHRLQEGPPAPVLWGGSPPYTSLHEGLSRILSHSSILNESGVPKLPIKNHGSLFFVTFLIIFLIMFDVKQLG